MTIEQRPQAYDQPDRTSPPNPDTPAQVWKDLCDRLGFPWPPVESRTVNQAVETILMEVYEARVEELKGQGQIRRAEQIETEEEQEEHFDELARVYREWQAVCEAMGIEWPGWETNLDY